MLNYIWLGLMLISLIFGAITGNLKAVTDAAIEYAGVAVDISLGLIGIMAFWLGIMKIAEKGGIIRILSRAIRPLARILFPDIPKDHPAIGSMMMNVVANWLGLSNAATPLGLKAMEELQELNPDKETATNAQVIFLAINTASITIIPMTVIALRTKIALENNLTGVNPFEVISTGFFASTIACITAVTAAKLLQRLPNVKKSNPMNKLSKAEVENE
ncbi:MAG: nucleoside recognition protein [Candidatus Marinimicrobia bacterium]|nr:nucleoside recognition protein [Candidatus Neomarinimicrobiota bacterium]